MNQCEIEIPQPVISTHTVPKNKWTIAMPNISGVSNEQEKPKTIWDFFHLESGWALKSKQKYGKKETGKRISKK
ncbi:16575_t:CDS:2, partial [Gigaspora rosea]